MKINKTNVNIAIGVINCIISALQSLWYIPYLSGRLGSDAYGYIAVINSFINILSIVTLAITSMSTRFISIELQRGNKEKANGYFNSILFSLILAALVILASSIFVSNNLGMVMNYTPDYEKSLQVLLILVFISFCVQLISTPFLSTLYYKNEISIYYIVLIADYIARIVLTLVLFHIKKAMVLSIAISDIIVFSCGLMVYNIYRLKKVKELRINYKYFDYHHTIEIIKSGMWVSITKAGNVLLSNLNTYYSNLFCGVLITGVYATIQQVSTMITMVLSTLVNCFLPDMYRLYAKANNKELLEYSLYSMKIVGVFIGIITGGIISLGGEFLYLWVGEAFLDYRWILVLSVCYLPLVLPSEIINQVAITTNRIKEPALITLLVGVVNLCMVLLSQVVFKLGIKGIIISNTVTLVIRSLCYFPKFLGKALNAQVNFSFYMSYVESLAVALLTTVIGVSITLLINNYSWVSLIMKSLFTGVFSLSILCIFDRQLRQFITGFLIRRN